MIKKMFTNRWVLATLCFLFLGLLIWFIGPLFGFGESRPLSSETARLLFILALLLLWGAVALYKFLKARQANRKLMDGITAQGPDASDINSSAEIEMLRKRIAQAITTLKKAGGNANKWGGEYLYQIPWYIFIGAPGSGKTTALINCGLRFPVSADGDVHAVKGVGGTRNCDWWFTDDAVFLDTAGRYTTQESDKKADSAAWLGFLGLLKKFRNRSPLNGAIVTVSLSDLLFQSERERDEYAMTVRTRIQELYQKLGVNFPIYLMVTKTDLLAGFMEFFSNFGSEERAQVLGVTFPYAQSTVSGYDFSRAFEEQFDIIDKRLNACLTDRLQQERDLQRRALIYGFSQQFSAVGPLLARFIEQVFSDSRYGQRPMLRGVYFTSGTQEGTPIDRVLGSLSRMLKMERKVLAPMAASGKSFFLTKLIKEVIFPESGLVSLDEKKEKNRKLLLRGAYVLIALLAVGMVAAWTFSYFKNDALIKDVQAKVAVLAQVSTVLPQPSSDDLNNVIPFLNELRNLPYGYAEQEKSVDMSYRFGLFQGDSLGDMANESYKRALGTVFLPRIALLLEDQIRNSPRNEIKYEALKAYLMLFDDKHLDPESLGAFLAADWELSAQEGASENSQQDFVTHLTAALKNRPLNVAWAKDDALIAEARSSLASYSLADRMYGRARILGVPQGIQPVKLSDMVGPAGSQIFERAGGESLSAPLPAIFTYAGYHEGFSQMVEKIVSQMADEDKWVLGEQNSSVQDDAGKALLLDAVKQRYFEDYNRNWDAVLGSIRLKRSTSLSDTVMYARVLSAADSPLKKLLVGVVKEVTLTKKVPSVQDKVEGKLMDSAKQMAARLLSGVSNLKRAEPGSKQPESFVDEHFEAIRQLVIGQPMPLDQTLALLNTFYLEASNFGSGVQGGVADIKPLSSMGALKAEAERLPVPLSQILMSLVGVSSGQAAAVNQAAIQKAVGGASSFCNAAIPQRYPVNRSAQNDILLADFNSVFAPGGELDNFFNANLRAIVDTSGRDWRLMAGADAAGAVSASVIRQFQNADAIRRAFFRGGSTTLVSAELRLLSSEWPSVTLQYNGETHQFSPENNASWIVRWPAQNGGGGARLFAVNPQQGIGAGGGWAIFRLIDKAMVDSNSPEYLRLVFMIEGRRVEFELRSSSVLNPFKLKELGRFQCPGRH